MKKSLSYKVTVGVAIAAAFLAPLAGFAQTEAVPISTVGGAVALLRTLVNWMIVIFWILTVAFLVWAAFTYLTAGGEDEKLKEAKSRVIYALIAGVIAILATGVQTLVGNILKGQ